MKKDERLSGYYDEQLETLPWDSKKQFLENQLQRAVMTAFKEAPAMREKFQAAGINH